MLDQNLEQAKSIDLPSSFPIYRYLCLDVHERQEYQVNPKADKHSDLYQWLLVYESFLVGADVFDVTYSSFFTS